jgi:hypothetical protein
VMAISTVFTFVMRFGGEWALKGQRLSSPGMKRPNGRFAETC